VNSSKSNTDRIPFLDLVASHQEIEADLQAVFAAALKKAAFIGGPAVEGFERGFAEFCETRFAVGVSNGTDALKFALLASGIGQGDTVITVPNTFAATVEAILQVGAKPEFVDIDPRTFNIDVTKLQRHLEERCTKDDVTGELISRRTQQRVAAILPVHLYGQMADMDPIMDLADRYKLKVIEDACQAHGARYWSRRFGACKTAGSLGVAAAFSFYPGKNLGACGEAGAVTTQDEEIARRVMMLRDHGQSRKYYHDIEGFNGRLDAVQAGILSVKLKRLPEWNRLRQGAASVYQESFSNDRTHVVLPFVPAGSDPVYHLYVIRTDRRSELQAHLSANYIDTGIHYPIALHLQTAFQSLGYQRGDFPAAEQAADQILSLPMYPQLRSDQQEKVVEAIRAFLADRDFALESPQFVDKA
jgi:dTDP-4-amino-4,6-dideoxygalactose transaminase